jgi:8-oxo-dGTP pyrophosphatase MutT (NUDIX family)
MSATPAIPRPAATVMVVRPAGDEYELFMVRRHHASRFAAGAYVFPGGTERADDRLDPADAATLGLDAAALHQILAARDDPFAGHPDGGLSLWLAALRELFEEAGVLLAETVDGRPLDLEEPATSARFAELRNLLQGGSLSLPTMTRSEGLRLSADRLTYFSRWITPISSPRRFDTRFFLAAVPAGQTAGHCQIETIDGVWISPREALARHAAEELPMMSVTREHIKRLADFPSLPALLEFGRTKTVRVVQAQLDAHQQPFHTAEQLSQW